MKKFILILIAIPAFLLVVIFITIKATGQSIPEGKAGPAAEELASKIEQAVKLDAWLNNTAAVSFHFAPRPGDHFRDLKRGLVEVRWKIGDVENLVQYNNKTRVYLARQNNQPVGDLTLKDELFKEAVARQTNDLFWLNPFSMLRAPGTVRKLVGKNALLLTFQSGGVTPGDSYLIVTDDQGNPEYIRMWVDLFPISLFQGFKAEFGGWKDTASGTRLSLIHKSRLASIDLKNVKTYPVYPVPGQPDRFGELLKLSAAPQ